MKLIAKVKEVNPIHILLSTIVLKSVADFTIPPTRFFWQWLHIHLEYP